MVSLTGGEVPKISGGYSMVVEKEKCSYCEEEAVVMGHRVSFSSDDEGGLRYGCERHGGFVKQFCGEYEVLGEE